MLAYYSHASPEALIESLRASIALGQSRTTLHQLLCVIS
jgi:hypothetical protein